MVPIIRLCVACFLGLPSWNYALWSVRGVSTVIGLAAWHWSIVLSVQNILLLRVLHTHTSSMCGWLYLCVLCILFDLLLICYLWNLEISMFSAANGKIKVKTCIFKFSPPLFKSVCGFRDPEYSLKTL